MWDTCPILRAIDFVGFPLNLLNQFFFYPTHIKYLFCFLSSLLSLSFILQQRLKP
ncbi:hypothetical protein HanXRQr2_Chr14g0644161 [Helianthus annuus]|uniref:Uncharacterized protein n=1 Tax=Helianthus annuus TaxID=4232 RepID=A0A9K3H6A8_HELAN|nr:hypothetical protein HanXRQr2_Chr14g0644161 [Helianthus annuus]